MSERDAGSAAPPMHDWVWHWLHSRRSGHRYQPGQGATGDDTNGCAEKADAICGSGLRADGAHLLSIGASAGYYEHAIASRLASANSPLASAHLIDIDATALDEAAVRLACAGVRDVRCAARAAESVTLAPAYDIALFLSLFHHYDRLGGSFRDTGYALLRDVASRSRVLFFETGQTDDRQQHSHEWRHALSMGDDSPREWLMRRVPQITGYTDARHLATNSQTGRHLCMYWHRDRAPWWLAAEPARVAPRSMASLVSRAGPGSR